MSTNRQVLTLLTFDPITTAVTGLTSASVMPGRSESLTLFANFAYGSGGTTLKAWVQTTMDQGVTWFDIAAFAFTTAAKKSMFNLTDVAVTTIDTTAAAKDGTLADDTCVNGFIGPLFRVKYTSTGTYAGATSLNVYALVK